LHFHHILKNYSLSNVETRPIIFIFIGDERIIEKLEKRNALLLKKLEGDNITDKKYDELKNAVENNYIRKYWIASRG